MANKTSKLTIVIAGKDQGAQKALKQTQTGVQGLGGAAKAMGAQVAGALTVGAVAAFGKKAIADASAYAGEVAKIARITGTSAKDASLIAFSAKNAGVEASKAAASYVILSKNIANGKAAAEGIVTTDQNGKLLSFDQILGNVADKLHNARNATERTALAVKLFGRGGADMAKILGKGSAALEGERKKMHALGLEFTEQNLANYKKFIQTQRDIKGALLGVEIGISNGLIPRLNQMGDTLGHLPLGPFKNLSTDFEVATKAGSSFGGMATQITSVFGDLVDKGLGISHTTTATGKLNTALDKTGQRLQRLNDHFMATTAATKAMAAADKSYSDKVNLKSAIEDVASATEDLNVAREAEKGNSDEYRAAVQQERDDLQQLADDQAAVTEAVIDAGDAQKELTQARADAADKVRSLRDEVVKANMAERDSVLALHEAQAEARRVLADPKATKLDKERAQAELLDAQDKATQATKDKAQAAKEAANATIEGDSGVIAAHKRVEDAQKAIGAAEKKVSDDRAAIAADGLAKTKILNDAAKTRKDAEKKVADALFAQAEAFRQIQTDSKGPIAGLQAFADALGSIKNASPEVRMLLAQVQAIINQSIMDRGPEKPKTTSHITVTHGETIDSSHSGNPQGPPSPDGSGGYRGEEKPEKGPAKRRNLSGGTTNITVHIAGTSRQHGRMIGAAVGSTIDKHTRRRRG